MRTQDGSDTEASVAHLNNSRRWLQLVYDRLSEDSPDTLIAWQRVWSLGFPPEHGDIILENTRETCQPILSVKYEFCETPGSITKILLTCGPSNECWKMRSVSKA